MLKIVPHEPIDGAEALRLEGKVVGRWVGELRRACEEVLDRSGGRLILDLADVAFLDAEGVTLLRQLLSRDVELMNCSPFASEQLREENTRS